MKNLETIQIYAHDLQLRSIFAEMITAIRWKKDVFF